MARLRLHPEGHLVSSHRLARAAVLGANDGIVSTASLIVGVAAASGPVSNVLIAGVAGLVAGAMSMAAGNTYRSAPNPTRNRQILRGSEPRLKASPNSNVRNSPKSTCSVALT